MSSVFIHQAVIRPLRVSMTMKPVCLWVTTLNLERT